LSNIIRVMQDRCIACLLILYKMLINRKYLKKYKGPYPGFVNGYLLDILVPFGFYFLLCLSKFPLLKSWIVKSILMFGVASFVEIAQFFGVPMFGQIFDPVDFVMFEMGVILAAILDIIVFPRIFDFWTPKAKGSI